MDRYKLFSWFFLLLIMWQIIDGNSIWVTLDTSCCTACFTQDYISLVIREDLKDISRVSELDKIEHLLLLLSPRIMAPLSMANLAGELEVAHTTVKSWLEQLRRLFVIFSVPPWTRKISRGLRKEKKWYFLDWLYAPEGPARLENMVATCLFRACSAMTDMGYGNYKLYYLRTIDKREIDFIIEVDNSPMTVIEVKSTDRVLSNSLRNRHRWFPKPTLGIQVVDRRGVLEKHPDQTWFVSIERFLSLLVWNEVWLLSQIFRSPANPLARPLLRFLAVEIQSKRWHGFSNGDPPNCPNVTYHWRKCHADYSWHLL